jgi:large subunit ribosomal protein L24
MKSIKSRKQRKEYFNAPLHKKRKWISSHMDENLLLKYDRRSMPLVKDDTVKVMRGSYKGHEGKVTRINQRRRQVEVEGLVMTKADGKKIAKPIHASNLLITKLNLIDRWRRKKLEKNLSDELKKEIEKEAEEQIIETEKEKKIQEEKIEQEKKIKEEQSEKTVKKIDESEKKDKSITVDKKEKIEELTDKDNKEKIDKIASKENKDIKIEKKSIDKTKANNKEVKKVTNKKSKSTSTKNKKEGEK